MPCVVGDGERRGGGDGLRVLVLILVEQEAVAEENWMAGRAAGPPMGESKTDARPGASNMKGSARMMSLEEGPG